MDEKVKNNMNRSQEIIRTSWIGIIANVLLAVFKAVVGVLASSVAIVMDAVNNLSDALSSVITIVGTKLSQRPAEGSILSALGASSISAPSSSPSSCCRQASPRSSSQ